MYPLIEYDNLPFDPAVLNGLMMSAVAIIALWTIRVVLIRAVSRRSEILSPDQRRWTQTVRTAVWILIFLGLIFIWAPQLHTVALSLTAFVVAIVIATKEVIMCFMGAFMRVSTAPFRMGDWITIDGITGEVVDINPFSAKVQELDTTRGTYSFTGRIIQIPNSRYFTFPIENLSYLKQFKSHQFDICFQCDMLDPAPLLKKLEQIVETHTKDLQEEATQIWKRTKRNSHIVLPDPEPQIRFTARDFNNMHFTVRAYLPTRSAAVITSDITSDFMSVVAKARRKQRQEEEKWRHPT